MILIATHFQGWSRLARPVMLGSELARCSFRPTGWGMTWPAAAPAHQAPQRKQ
jgi:hypothetical protein